MAEQIVERRISGSEHQASIIEHLPLIREIIDLDRDTELVFCLVGSIGTDLDVVIRNIKKALEGFEYKTETIAVTGDVIDRLCKDTPKFDGLFARKDWYMKQGNLLREKYGNDVLAIGAVYMITEKRKSMNASRRAFIIKSVKHPDEVKMFRAVYGNGFFLIGANSDYNRKLQTLIEAKRMTSDKAKEIIHRDENDEYKYGQKTRDVFHLSDYFIDVTSDEEQTKCVINRFIDLIFGHPFITPTFGEYAMFMAYCNSMRSSDLSRQVGAVICKNDEVVANGANDCGQFGGGLYWMEYSKDSKKYVDKERGRDYLRSVDSNKQEIKVVTEAIMDALKIRGDKRRQKCREQIMSTALSNITEYSRVVHAEMEALMMCSRNNISSRGADLYCTTFPCHTCAKLIIAAGIRKVVYIEPYPKSKTLQYFDDSMMSDDDYGRRSEYSDSKVVLKPFYGVGPRRYIPLFQFSKPGGENTFEKKRKDMNENAVKWDEIKGETRAIISMNRSAYPNNEKFCVAYFIEQVKV